MIMKPVTTNSVGKLAAVQKEIDKKFREAGLYTNKNESPSRMAVSYTHLTLPTSGRV